MIKNTKRAMYEFMMVALVVPNDVMIAFLSSHGFAPSWDMKNAEAVAKTVGADVARAQLEGMRKAAADALAAKRAKLLADARAAWMNGDARAFDKIHW